MKYKLQTQEKMLRITSHWGNANKSTTKISPHPSKDIIQKFKNTGKDVGKYTVGEIVNYSNQYGR